MPTVFEKPPTVRIEWEDAATHHHYAVEATGTIASIMQLFVLVKTHDEVTAAWSETINEPTEK